MEDNATVVLKDVLNVMLNKDVLLAFLLIGLLMKNPYVSKKANEKITYKILHIKIPIYI